MKSFNLEEALDGKPVVTRDGRKVTHITKMPNHNFIVGIIEGIPQIPQWAVNGNFLNDHYIHPCDLFMYTLKKRSIWVNVYNIERSLTIGYNYDTKEDAEENKEFAGLEYIKTIEITNEK